MSHDHPSQTPAKAVVGFFSSAESILKAMAKVRDAGFARYDAFTPFPVHGMDDAMGLKRSFLPFITFGAGLTGFICAFALEYWTSVIDWPINVGGKPLNSWPAFVPVMFEVTVLFSGITTAIGMLLINRLPNVTKAAFDPSITNNRFAILIEGGEVSLADRLWHRRKNAGSRNFSESDASQFLKSVGAEEVRVIQEEGWF